MRKIVAIALLAACKDPAKGVGDAPLDAVALADSEPLAHVAAALASDVASAGDLAASEALTWSDPPNPDAYFQTKYERHLDLPTIADPTTLRVLSYNVGLLSRRYAIVSKVAVPEIETRRAQSASIVFGAGYDVLLFQELWEPEDLDAFVAEGEAQGYRVWSSDRKKVHKETGIAIAVRADLVGGNESFTEAQFHAQWGLENFPGPNLKRGWIAVSFDLPDGTRAHVFDTHLTPFAEEWRVRNLQARELGLVIDALPDEDVVLVGGDLNAGWYYAADTWTDAHGEVIPDWFANATTLPLLLHYGGLQDAKNAAYPNEDVPLGDEVPRDNGAAMLEEPLGDATFCTTFPATTFTATDCNGLHFQSYAGDEFPARLDHVLFRDGTGRLRAVDQSLAFVEPIDFGDGGTFELSDHYGVEVTLELGAP